MTPRLFEKAEQPFEIPRPFGKEKNIYSYFGRKNSSYYPTTKVPERRLHILHRQEERERDPTILGTGAWRDARYFAWEIRQQDPNFPGTSTWRNAYAIERVLEESRL